MHDLAVRNWWVFVLRGALAIVTGVQAFARPDIGLTTLVTLFGAYALGDGIIALIVAPMLSGSRYFRWFVVDGILGMALGAATSFYPRVPAASVLLLLGIWLVGGGVARMAASVELRAELENDSAYVLGGALSAVAGVIAFIRPFQSALVWDRFLGGYALLYGALLLTVGAKLQKTSPVPAPPGR